MSRLQLKSESMVQQTLDGLYADAQRHIEGMPPGLCPVDVALTFLRISQTQSCGKCVPCRVGLGQLANLLKDVVNGKATMRTLDIIKETAAAVIDSADCAIGREGARLVLKSVEGFREDYENHIRHNHCISKRQSPVPCVSLCPASVDVPGYVALIHEGRYDDAVKLIRKDNPLPAACAYVCEHPCEKRCRRQLIDAPVNIRGLKRFAVDHAGDVAHPAAAAPTGRKVAIIGGGPSGLTAAYYLTLMGHAVTIFEAHEKLGGMVRYGIPEYRFPRDIYDKEIEGIIGLGIEARCGVKIGRDISLSELSRDYDAVYAAIGAQSGIKLGIPGEEAQGVISAVELLGGIGDGVKPDFTGKRVVVVGGGNVAMDATRTSLRLGASKVTCVYRRRLEDMTALPEEVEGAMAEGAIMKTLYAPAAVKVEDGAATALIAKPQIIGEFDRAGRPRPVPADLPEEEIAADIIIMAVGQSIESEDFEEAGIKVVRGRIAAGLDTAVAAAKECDMPGVDVNKFFSGGDCVTGPSTAIKAIAAGKVAAAQIDEFLGFDHEISVDVDIPAPTLREKHPRGRINTTGRDADECAHDFEDIECGMTCEGADAESSRCLRCDYFGYGIFRGGRQRKW